MSYITNTDIQERIGAGGLVQLSDDNNDGVADNAVLDEARLAAEGEMNAYLARRYQIPIDTATHPDVVDVLASVALDLVEYRLRLRRPPIHTDVVQRYDRTIDWLKAVADGAIHLPTVAAMASNSSQGIVAATLGEARLLSRAELASH